MDRRARSVCEVTLAMLISVFALGVQKSAVARWRTVIAVRSQSAGLPSPAASNMATSDGDPLQASAADGLASIRYELQAKLAPELRSIRANGSLRFTNHSSQPVNELWFHLYLNAFESSRTRFMRSPATTRRSKRSLGSPGGIQVHYLRSRSMGDTDLWQSAAKHSPGDPDDATDICVPLPHPIPPGSKVDFTLSFEAHLPEMVERTGYSNDFFLAAQWFPKLAKLETDGTWAHFTFYPQAEFYSDFSDFEVQLDVPSQYRVGASGKLTARRDASGRSQYTFRLSRGQDFAWTAWPEFVEEHHEIDGIAVVLLSPPGHEATRRATLDAVREGLRTYQKSFGRYPYETLTIVHPPQSASPAMGMEYPAFITTGSAWFAPLIGIRSADQVVLHELAHQWFFGTVASNEYRWPFLDEGLASFAEMRALEARWGEGSLLDWCSVRLSQVAMLTSLAASAPSKPATAGAIEFADFAELGVLAYATPAITLETLARIYGREPIDRALLEYSHRNRFRHATPQSLFDSVRFVVGSEASTSLETALSGDPTVDYRIRSISSSEDPSTHGFVSTIELERAGKLSFPVELLVIDSTGRQAKLGWNGVSRRHTLRHQSMHPIVGATLDPERRILLDRNRFNNSYQKRSSDMSGLQAALELAAHAVLVGTSL